MDTTPSQSSLLKFSVFQIIVLSIFVILFFFILTAAVVLYRKRNPVLFDGSNESIVIDTEDIKLSRRSYAVAQESLASALTSGNEAEIEFAKEAVQSAKNRFLVRIDENGHRINNVPSVPTNLTYTLSLTFEIKNHTNSYETFCVLYRGFEVASASPALFVDVRNMGLVLKMKDFQDNEMTLSTKAIPLQRINRVDILFENRKIQILMNGKLFKAHMLKNVPRHVDSQIFLLPGDASQHCRIHKLRYYDHPLEIRNYSVENFEQKKETKSGKRDFIVEPSECYDGFYAKVYTQLFTKSSHAKAKTRYEVACFEKHLNVSSEVRLEILDVGVGGNNHLTQLSKKYPRISCTGLDKSKHMLRETLAESNKTSTESPKNMSFIQGDAEDNELFESNTFSHIMCYGKTFYHLNASVFAKNVCTWLKPDGICVIHLVEPSKFKPMPTIVDPFIGILGPEHAKYAKQRKLESHFQFNTFAYDATFKLNEDTTAYVDEIFTFKDKPVTRKQRHILMMPELHVIKTVFEKNNLFYVTRYAYEPYPQYAFEYLYVFQKTADA